MERKLHRYKNLLYCVGSGVISFGIWSVIKMVMTFVRDKKLLFELMEQIVGKQYAEFGMIAMVIGVGVITVVDLILRVYIGMTARKDGMDLRNGKGRGYLVFAFILAVIVAIYMFFNFKNFMTLGDFSQFLTDDEAMDAFLNSIMDVTVETLIDATSLIMILLAIVAGIQVSRLEKKIKIAKEEEEAK